MDNGKPIISGPLETIEGEIEDLYILLDPISVDDVILIVSVGMIESDLNPHAIRDILCRLRNGNHISQEDAKSILYKVKSVTLDKKIIPSVTEDMANSVIHKVKSVTLDKKIVPSVTGDMANPVIQNYTPIPVTLPGKLNNVITKNKVFHASSDIARTFVMRDVIYLAVCESKTSNWWASSSKALCIAFKSRSETKEGVFRVFLLEFGFEELSLNYTLSISGPMADEHILKDYPIISEVYVLTKVSVDNIIDLVKVSMMIRDDSVMDLVGGKANGILTAVLGNCVKFYGDPTGSVVNAKYLATKFQKVASESLDTRLQPSKVERPVASSSTQSHSHTSISRKRRKHKKLQTQ